MARKRSVRGHSKNSGDSLSLNWSDVEPSIWANAKTYVDLPGGDCVEQRHLYSDFRLYEVHSKIVPR